MRKSLILAFGLALSVLLTNCNQTDSPAEPAANIPEAAATSQPGPAAQPDTTEKAGKESGQVSPPVEKTGSDPTFEDYPVTETFEGESAPLVFTSETRMFRSRLQSAAAQGPNFAGKYIIATWGCGTDCLMGGVVDPKTGNTSMIPFSICCVFENAPEGTEKVEFQKDSKLIIFNGLLDEQESDIRQHFYLFENNKFVPVSKNE